MGNKNNKLHSSSIDTDFLLSLLLCWIVLQTPSL
jgi:hypothetical protein